MQQPVLFIWIVVFLIIILTYQQERNLLKIRRKRRRRKEEIDMNELVQRFLGKNCYIYLGTTGGNLLGVIEAVEGNWVSVRTKDSVEVVNLDYICRIKEKPAKK